MRSDQIPFWRILLHMIGVHWWGDLQEWEVPDMEHDIDAEVGIYQNC